MRSRVASIVMRMVSSALLALALFVVLAPDVAARPLRIDEIANPRRHRQWITDAANLLGPDDERRMNARLAALDRDLGVELAVVTVDDVEGSPKDFATALLHHWRIGKSGTDSGVLVLLVRKRRRVEIDTGYGMEASLPDAWLGQMQVEQMVPRFRRNEYAGGLIAALDAIDARLRARPREDFRAFDTTPAPAPLAAVAPPESVSAGRAADASTTRVLTLGALGAGAVLPLGLLVRRRRRTCRACHRAMTRLAARERDDNLDEGQILEQKMGAVKHSVYRCPGCAKIAQFRRVRWFSGVRHCGRCQRRCVVTHETMLQAASTFQGGLIRTRSECNNCNNVYIEDKATPALPVVVSVNSDGSSSSFSDSGSGFSGGGGGDSGGGSFGGGDGGGGGAGSSW
jgi:uncharacterized protein